MKELTDNQLSQLAAALARAQGKVENAKKSSNNPHFKSKYADLASIWDVIREPLTSEGLSVVQLPCEAPDGKVGLVTVLLHSSGEHVHERFFLAVKDASNPQQYGSCLTYMKRYALLGVAGIASEDDDGEAASAPTRKAATIKTATEAPAFDVKAFSEATMAQLNTLPDMDARQLYSDVRNNNNIPQPHRNELLVKMSSFMQQRSKAESVSKEQIVAKLQASIKGNEVK